MKDARGAVLYGALQIREIVRMYVKIRSWFNSHNFIVLNIYLKTIEQNKLKINQLKIDF